MIRSAPICFADNTPSRPTAVTHDDHRGTRLHVGGVRRKPARAHHIGQGEEARDHVGVRNVAGGDQRAFGERHAHTWRLRADDGFETPARRLVAVPAVRAHVVGREERPDHELAGLERRDTAADLLDDAAVLMAHRDR